MMRFRKTSAFTLIELSLVLVVLSLLAGGVLTIATQNVRLAKKKELATKMSAIEDAVINFRKSHGYIPCPGDIVYVESDSNFGYQAANSGSCTSGTPAASFTIVAQNSVGGMVPVRTLGLPDDYARDPWGGKILYVVDKRATAPTTFAVAKLTDTSLIGSITVYDYAGVVGVSTPITSTAVMLLMSFGANGHGAYIGTGQKFMGSTNTHEWENCTCNATVSAPPFNATFYSHSAVTSSTGALDGFDDVVRFYSRAQLYSDTDTKTEK
jgi:prepilin-type N-terminal cleavage/methylation domain-containing protein